MDDAELLERVTRELAGHYAVERELARGGMSRVYVARDERHDRTVAVKILDPELAHSVAIARFEREIRLSAGLSHPNILPLLDSGRVGHLPYYVTPYIAESSVKQRLEVEPQLPVDEALRITSEVAAALEHAHAAGIVHRDIKPENILLPSGHAVVADFGIAQALALSAGERLTQSGAAIGTPAYMSPEQAAAEPGIDGRSDVYSLACVAYEMLAGTPPFTGRTTQAVMARHLADPPPSIRVVRPGVPEEVERAIARALAKVPADRFRSAGDFALALRSSADPRVPARRMGLTALLIAVAVLAIVLVWILPTGGPTTPPDPHGVVVFPLEGAEGPVGEGVASLVGYVLEDTDPLRWIEGWYLLDARDRESPHLVDLEEARALAEGAGAAHFVTGRIVTRGDSSTVILDLHATRPEGNQSSVARAGASGGADEPVTRLALTAVSELLLPLLEPGRTVDPGLLADRRPAALANFYLGESEYRRGRFEEALDHYFRALDQDSTLALAALRGAETAVWLKRFGEARAAAALAASQSALLPAAYRPLARGIRSLLQGEVDTALVQVRRHLDERPTSTAGWTMLGEGLLHHFPATDDADGEAGTAFRTALDLDPGFVPASYHLVEFAVLGIGDDAVAAPWADGADVELPPEIRAHIDLLLSCHTMADQPEGPQVVEGAASPATLLGVGFVLGVDARTRGCAEDALALVVEDDSAATSLRYAALQVLGSALVGAGRSGEAHRWTRAATEWSAGAPYLHLLWDVAEERTSADGRAQVARMWAEGVDGRPPSLVWLLGVWEAKHGNRDRAARLARRLADVEDGEAGLLAAALAAHVAAAEGRNDEALATLQALEVRAPVDRLQWRFWNALYPERLLQAELLLGRGDHDGARAVLDRLSPIYPRTAVSAAFGPTVSALRRSLDAS